jgi:DNA-binding NarL/FixJ family response regulator
MPTINRVIIADDHVLVRKSIGTMLSKCPGFSVIGEASDGFELLQLLNAGAAPDVIILDLSMPGLGGLRAIREIRRVNLDTRILVLTMHKEDYLLCQAFIEGADGYLLKDECSTELFKALDAILKAQAYISPILAGEAENAWLKVFIARKASPLLQALSSQELEILKLLAQGESTRSIAHTLGIASGAVGRSRASILQKLHLEGTANLMG